MKFDNYTDNPTIVNRHGYFDKSCKHYRSLYALYGFPTSMCKWNKTVCLGKNCNSYEPIIIKLKPKYIQLKLFDL